MTKIRLLGQCGLLVTLTSIVAAYYATDWALLTAFAAAGCGAVTIGIWLDEERIERRWRRDAKAMRWPKGYA